MENQIDQSALLSAIRRCSNENTKLVDMYKTAVSLLFISAVINVLLLAGWIWEINR